MARSLHQFGQLAPVTACWREGRAELLDGFKRRTAAAQVGWRTLSVRRLDADERSAKAAIFALNSVGRRPNELEEAWIVQALVREDGLSQVEAATLLGRAQELGVSATGPAGAPGGIRASRSAAGVVVAGPGATVDAVARGQPGRRLDRGAAAVADDGRGARTHRSAERSVAGAGSILLGGPARCVTASGRRVHAGARSPSESRSGTGWPGNSVFCSIC